jgi:peptidyl-prolyl cis-trans isomerase D
MAPFETVRDDLRQTIAQERAERRVAELASEVEAVAFENPTTLEPAAEVAGLDVQSTQWIDESSAEGDIIGDPGVLGTAFSDEAQERRENSELIELEDGGYAVIRVTDHRPSRIEPLQEVRGEARSAYRDERAAEAARADADRIAEAVNGGESPARAADRIGRATYNEARWSGRNDRSLPAGVRERGFRLPAGDDSGARAGVGRLPDGWATVFVEAVRSGDPSSVDDQRRRALRQTLNDLDAQASSRAVVAALRDRADIQVREENL